MAPQCDPTNDYATGRKYVQFDLNDPAGRQRAADVVTRISTNSGYDNHLDLKRAPGPLETVKDVKAAMRAQLMALTGTNDLSDQPGDDGTKVDFENLTALQASTNKQLHCLHAQSKVKIDSNLCGGLHPSLPRTVQPHLLKFEIGDSIWAPISFPLMDGGMSVTDYAFNSAIPALYCIKVRLCYAIDVQATGCWALVNESCQGNGPDRKPEDMRPYYAYFQDRGGFPSVPTHGLPPIQIDGVGVKGGCAYMSLVWIPFTEGMSKGEQKLSPTGILQATAYLRAQVAAMCDKAESTVSPKFSKAVKAESKGYLNHELLVRYLKDWNAEIQKRIDLQRYVPRKNFVRHLYAGSKLVASPSSTPEHFDKSKTTDTSVADPMHPLTADHIPPPTPQFGLQLPALLAASKTAKAQEDDEFVKKELTAAERLFNLFKGLGNICAKPESSPVEKASPAGSHAKKTDTRSASKGPSGIGELTPGDRPAGLSKLPKEFSRRAPGSDSLGRNANIAQGETTVTGDLMAARMSNAATGSGKKRVEPDSQTSGADRPGKKAKYGGRS